ncbi:uncharacterized protein EV420DRAFT_1476949 [Desarmillaria tabescens]|uniref:Uncharacterized protein n=1 Tax=Armillaria tabescens TaxID=1929756 RepID=A0AA39ND07_ARMTA|nr:uncharacterized protein EV420DRAFT_1476949 [Desarmillaria tabescens]KAK0463238.1 hypothetical protein EV420DRAFT_1476949 [Desarmillaria tabescens]
MPFTRASTIQVFGALLDAISKGAVRSFDPCAEERLVEMWESERFFGVPKDIAPQENIIPYEFWYDSLPSIIFINVGFLQRDGQEYLSFDTVGPLPAVDTPIFYYSSRGWRDATLIAQTELVWMESNDSSPGGDVTSESRGKIAVMRCLSHSPIYNVLGEPGESGSLVFTKDDGKLIAVGGHAGERYALVQSLEGILDDLRESIPDIRLPPSPVA